MKGTLSLNTQHNILHQHTYWNPLYKFILSKDVYEEWSAFCIEEGTLHYQLGTEQGIAHFGDIIFCPPHIPMNRHTNGVLKFHFIRFTPPTSLLFQPGKKEIKNKIRLKTTYEYLRQFAFIESPSISEVKAHLLKDIIIMNEVETYNTEGHQLDTIHDSLISDALSIIQKRAHESISMKNISAQLGLSNVQFSRRFLKAVGTTPGDYLTSLRMRRARNFLLETEKTMEDIAVTVGYQNGFYFSRIFKKKVGVSPSEFRKRHQF